MKKTEYYGLILEVTSDFDSVCCVVQQGTGNTIETSELVERWYPTRMFLSVFPDKVDNSPKYFKLKTIEKKGSYQMIFTHVIPTPEITDLFIKPDYFKDMENSPFFTKE